MRTFVGLVDEDCIQKIYDRYVWADSCCFDGIEWCEKNHIPFEILSHLDLNHDEVYEKYRYFENIRIELIKYAPTLLNKYQGTSYSYDKWETLISSALINLIPSIYDKYKKIKKALSFDECVEVNLYRVDEYVVPLDYYDLMFLMNEDGGYHRLLYSLILPIVDEERKLIVNRSDYRRNEFKSYHGDLPVHIKEFVEQYKKNKEITGIKDDIVIQSQLIKFTVYKDIIGAGEGRITGYFKNYYTDLRNDLSWDVDYRWRNKERDDIPDTNDKFLLLMYRILPKILPIAYVEDFKTIREESKGNYIWGDNPKTVIFDATELHSDEMFKIFLMEKDRIITKRVGIQHAGFYGFGGDIWGKIFEMSQYDEFFGTGCYSDVFEKIKITQMPLITLFRMPKINRDPKSKKILFLNSSWPKNCSGMVTKQCDYYINEDIAFLKGLRESILDRVVIRYYPFSGFGYDIEKSFRKEIKDVKFDNNTNLYDSLTDTQLLISSGIGTSVIEAMRAGIPTLIMLNPQISDHVLSKSSEDLDIIDEMIETDLIAESPSKLDDIVNKVYDGIDGWWNEPRRKRIVSRILESISFFPSNASEMWTYRIIQELRMKG